jgi:glycosyltransferase involved in cell wall biosynthesis
LVVNGPLPPPFGGISTYLAHALPYLASRGFEVHTVMDKRPTDPSAYERFTRAGVRIHYGGGSRTAKAMRILRWIPLWVELARVSRLPLRALLPTIASQVSWVDAVERLLRTGTIDVVHTYDYPWIQGFVATALARRYGVPCVQTTFGEVVPHRSELSHHDDVGEPFRRLSGEVLRRTDVVLAMSRHCARELDHVGLPEDRVRVIYYGIDLERFHPRNDGGPLRERMGWGQRPVLLFLGHLRPRKGPQVLLEAVPAILRSVPDALVVFVGPDYDMRAGMQARARELAIESAVTFLGPQPDEVIPALYAACSVFVFPTCTPIECLGLSMVQAMATGRPVVGSDINGIPEVILPGATGELVPPSDAPALAAALIKVLTDPQRAARMGELGRKRAEEVFNQDRLVDELGDLYRSIAAARPL